MNTVLDILKSVASAENFSVWGYSFMPDHLHLALEGTSAGSDLKRFVSRFKQRSGYEFKRRFGRFLWQKSYYDHVLREDEDLIKVCLYIWGNPVRKGLVEKAEDYPYSGSLVPGVWERHH